MWIGTIVGHVRDRPDGMHERAGPLLRVRGNRCAGHLFPKYPLMPKAWSVQRLTGSA
jgi:hypothetical protein